MDDLAVVVPIQKKKRESKFTPEVRAERVREQTRRAVLARSRALTLLGKRYPEEFAELRQQERLLIDSQCDPVPGD